MTHTAVETGLYGALSTGAGTAFFGTRIYAEQAPAGATLPYVRFSLISGGDEQLTPDRSINLMYQVECWAATQADARTGAGYLESALNHVPITVSGYTVFWQGIEGWISDVENVEGKQYWRRGFEVRINASK